MSDVKRKIVHVNKDEFEKAVKRYAEKIECEKNIKKEVKKLLPKYRVTNKFFEDVETNFYNALAETYKDKNAMNIKPRKLATLLELDTNMLEVFAIAYRPLMQYNSPSIEQYTTYAETEDELKKHSVCEKLLKTIKEIQKVGKVYPSEVERAFGRILIYNLRTQDYDYNWRWIKAMRDY